MSQFTPSKYQVAIYDFIQNGHGNAVINAVAGSGKSTTLVNALKLIPADQSVLFLAFNKSIVEELKIKVGNLPNVTIRTLHSLGASALMKQLHTNTDRDKYKVWLNSGVKYGNIKPTCELEAEEVEEWKGNIRKLTDLMRVNLCESMAEGADLAMKHGLFLYDNEIEIAWKAIQWGKGDITTIDFTDMIFLPNIMKIRMPQYDWVLIDECQDLNAAQRGMFLKCVKKGGRFIAVGDPQQAIYGFAGADVESFNLLKGLPDTQELPLSVCYRCDAEIIKMAKTIVPQIEARDGAPEGVIDQQSKMANIQDGDMILCRNTAPLTNLCMKYIASGVKAYIKGKDIGTNLINMLEKTRRTNIAEAMSVLQKELNKIAEKIAQKERCDLAEARKSPTYEAYNDKIQALEVLSEGLSQTRQLVSRIEEIFSDDSRKGICLSTIHKAKGLEADRVFIACPDKLYNKRAMRIAWMAEQEKNLVYVAYTRAKHYLGFIADFSA